MSEESRKRYVVAYDDETSIVDLIQKGLERDERYCVKAIRVGVDTTDLEAVLTSIREHYAESLRAECPFLLLADNVVPGFNLSDIFNGLDPQVRIVVITGWITEEILNAYSSEVTSGRLVACVAKPFRIAELKRVTDAFFEGHEIPETVTMSNEAPAFDTVHELNSEIEAYLAQLSERTLDEKLLAKGKQIVRKALGFVDKFVQAPGDQGIKAHAARGLLAVLEAALDETAAGSSPERIMEALRRILSQFGEVDKPSRSLGALLSSGSIGKLTVTAANVPALPVHVDMEAVETIVNNLIINANAHPDITSVQFEVRETEEEILILVNDNGPALPEGFFTPKPLDTRAKRGNGARDMLMIAKSNGWTFEAGTAWGRKFALRIPKKK